MKQIPFCILLFFLGHHSLAQVKTGVYIAIGDSVIAKTGRTNDDSKLSLSTDHTFSYQHRTSQGATFWFDKKGTWDVRSNRLYLNIPDSACRAVFKIQGNVLRYLFNMCEPGKPGWDSKQNISGNFIFKQE